MRHTVCLWMCILILTPSVSGASLDLSGSSSYAVFNQSFTLTCTVSQAADINDKIVFYWSTTPDAFASLSQKMDSCTAFNVAPSGYSASCGRGTDRNLSTTKKYNLEIKRATERDATGWWCGLYRARTRSNAISLQFSRGPDTVTFNLSLPGSVTEEQSLTVTCAASCNPTCDYSWTLGNQLISSTSRLSLTNINRSQTGNVYTCNVTNSLIPKSKTKQFTLTVYYGPDSVQLNSSSPLIIQEDDDLVVSCEATNCSPSCSFTWRFKSEMKSTSAVLSLKNIQRSSAGDYTCTARNKNTQKSLDETITLDVQYRSSISSLTLNSQSTKLTIEELTPMTLRCNVDSNPGSDIKLVNKSQTLREVTNSKQAEYMWNEAGCLDTGHYTCEAGNNIKSSVSESVQLVVKCSPRLDHRVPFKDRFGTAVGDDVTLSISVIANPTPTFTWYRLSDGKKMILTSGSSTTTDVSAVSNRTLINVQQRDFGIYQVVVSNRSPQADLVVNITLVEEGPPSIPSNVIVWSDVSSLITVAWTEEFNGGLPQTFLVQYRADTAPKWTNLTRMLEETGLKTNHGSSILNLQSRTRYRVRVLSYNKLGHKGFTHEQEVLTGDSAPTIQKDNLLGAGIGIGIGIMVGIVLLVGGLILTFWLMRKAKAKPEHPKRQPISGIQETSLYEDMEQTTGDRSSTPANVSSNYSSLEARIDAPYDVLGVYDNTPEIKE